MNNLADALLTAHIACFIKGNMIVSIHPSIYPYSKTINSLQSCSVSVNLYYANVSMLIYIIKIFTCSMKNKAKMDNKLYS